MMAWERHGLGMLGKTSQDQARESGMPQGISPAFVSHALRPSEYTASLIQAIRAQKASIKGVRALEMGSGSGVVLAALGKAGAASLCGIDIEEGAIRAGRALMDQLGLKAEFRRGNMWKPVADRRFDLVVANLPQFPMRDKAVPGRLPSWSVGGPNGRKLLDPFITGLADHLTPNGRAIITHNAFLGLERSRSLSARRGMALRVVDTTVVAIPDEKMQCMTPEIREGETGRTIYRYGAYAFGYMHIVEIKKPVP
jgi:methylase of polypeptide subunit release factors